MPISLRAAGDTGSDNQASMSVISLGTQIADAARRLDHVKAARGSVKSILPTDYPSIGAPWLLESGHRPVWQGQGADKTGQVANVPGPPVEVTTTVKGAKVARSANTSKEDSPARTARPRRASL